MGSLQQICLKWNNHLTNFPSSFEQLLQRNELVDVTIACERRTLKAHKLVLSACSPFFLDIFTENPCQHPVVILKDAKFVDVEAIVQFMYKGEVNVSHDQLTDFLKTAEALQVKGLADDSSVPRLSQSPNSETIEMSQYNTLNSVQLEPVSTPRLLNHVPKKRRRLNKVVIPNAKQRKPAPGKSIQKSELELTEVSNVDGEGDGSAASSIEPTDEASSWAAEDLEDSKNNQVSDDALDLVPDLKTEIEDEHGDGSYFDESSQSHEEDFQGSTLESLEMQELSLLAGYGASNTSTGGKGETGRPTSESENKENLCAEKSKEPAQPEQLFRIDKERELFPGSDVVMIPILNPLEQAACYKSLNKKKKSVSFNETVTVYEYENVSERSSFHSHFRNFRLGKRHKRSKKRKHPNETEAEVGQVESNLGCGEVSQE